MMVQSSVTKSNTSSHQKQSTDPLKVLLCELLVHIFCIWIQDALDDPSTDLEYNSLTQLPTSLCRVSKSWRDFVYACPVLWTYITIEASEGVVTDLPVFQERLKRSQSAPLFVNVIVGEHPHKDALRVLFAECSRFRQLALEVLDMSWLRDFPMKGFTQLEHLVVMDMNTEAPAHKDELGAVFSSAPRLRRVEWHSASDPGSITVIGHQLHFLDLSATHLPITCVLKILAACPNLRRAAIFMDRYEQVPAPLIERVLLPDLCSLYLTGTRHIARILGCIRAPQLRCLDAHWTQYDGRAQDLESLGAFLEYSPHLVDIALQGFLQIEDGLINIIMNNKNLTSLSVTGKSSDSSPRKLITERTFKLLTRQEGGEYGLPRLEKLVFRCGLDVPDEVVLRMIESRMSPPGDSSGSRGASTLKYICLDRCKPMAVESISRLWAMYQENGLKVEGAFANPNQPRYIYLDF
ncbi:hypothetical protein PAXRUDRAFT_365416 [Paxillus rubicundulus Ve08.2h10]|uniref:F-box domain-containing protein n=1 Tax=Paxillus rubicundulus Ve08.2h10 TaxID=930991 RepID=A0A0D0DE39_9AGAM|nr:hypothetical protein PAXRUDRAFT_365416 [Paxillus rubicundulus Ve08.2h10]